MDDLDRLYRRLLDAVRDGAPHLRERRFRLGDIPQHLLPYRLHRRELGFESVQQYERALVRLAAGERGYLSADGGVHEAFRRAAADPATPVDQLLRTYGDVAVALAPDSRHRPDRPDEGPTGAAAPDATAPAAAGPAPGARDVDDDGPLDPHTAEMAIPTPMPAGTAERRTTGAPSDAPPASRPASPPSAPDAAPPLDLPIVRTPRADAPAAIGASVPTAAPPAAEPPDAMPFPVRPPAQVAGGTCPHCGRPLPTERSVTFCPYCGENLTVRRCPACSTELEAGWRFCITCGREVDAATPELGP